MDVLVLIDKLDDLVHNAKAVPLTDQVRIDREEIYDILDQMRATIPEEIKQARWIVKGLRVISDFEWEFQMNQLNRHLAPEIETVYVMASPLHSFISSSGVKEIAEFGGNVDELVPPAVARRFRDMFPEGKGGAPTSPQE
jgi:pantetheine-phosphate adenylyltransferase